MSMTRGRTVRVAVVERLQGYDDGQRRGVEGENKIRARAALPYVR